jgi:hypothetical protein
VTTARDVPERERPHAAGPRALERLLDRHSWMVFALFASVCLYSLIIRARAKPFWHDEIYTILHAGLPTVGMMWAASLDGIDLSPPLNTWVTRGVHAALDVGHIATRLPPIVGYLVMTGIVFHLIRRRSNTMTALSAAILPCMTAAYRYSYEARAYGLMLGLFAVSLYAWTEAARGRARRWHLPLLAVTLAAAVWNHYYGVLTFIPIAGGEIVRTLRRRRIDSGMVAAFAGAALSLVPLYPLSAVARTQSQSFWAPAAWADVLPVYQFLFAPVMEQNFLIAAAVIAAAALLLRRPAGEPSGRALPAHETAAGVLTLLIPIAGVILGLAVTGVFVPRYALPSVLGLSLVIPLAVWHRDTRAGLAELLLCSFLVVSFAMAVGPSLVAPPTLRDPFETRPLLRAAVTSGLPVVSASSLQFLQYWYYAPPDGKGRLRYLADVDEARKYMQSDTIDRGYLTLRRWTAVPVDRYSDYVAGHREFRVHEAGGGWLLPKLAEAGATKDQIGQAPGERLFLVRVP